LLQEKLKQEIHVVERPQYIVSTGAALTAKQHYMKSLEKSAIEENYK